MKGINIKKREKEKKKIRGNENRTKPGQLITKSRNNLANIKTFLHLYSYIYIMVYASKAHEPFQRNKGALHFIFLSTLHVNIFVLGVTIIGLQTTLNSCAYLPDWG